MRSRTQWITGAALELRTSFCVVLYLDEGAGPWYCFTGQSLFMDNSWQWDMILGEVAVFSHKQISKMDSAERAASCQHHRSEIWAVHCSPAHYGACMSNMPSTRDALGDLKAREEFPRKDLMRASFWDGPRTMETILHITCPGQKWRQRAGGRVRKSWRGKLRPDTERCERLTQSEMTWPELSLGPRGRGEVERPVHQ